MPEAMAWTLKDRQKVPNTRKWVRWRFPYFLLPPPWKIKSISNNFLHSPQGNGVLFQPASEFLPMIDEVYKQLVEKTKTTEGAKVENNKFCVSVHFRCVEEKVYIATITIITTVPGFWDYFVFLLFTYTLMYILMYSCQTWKKKEKKKSAWQWMIFFGRNGVNWPNKLNQYWKSTQNYVLPKEERWHGVLSLSIVANNLLLVNNGSLISVLFV